MVARIVAAALGLVLAGCQTHGETSAALLERADAETLSRVKAVLADAMQKTSVELGPVDLSTSSVIPVLPPPLGPLQGNSPATPILFDLMTSGGDCVLVRRDSGESFALEGVNCRAAD